MATLPTSETPIDSNLLVAQSLKSSGIDHMFSVVGIPVTSLANRAVQVGIRFIAFHNEQSAGYAAFAYGYLTRKPCILLTVSGPGCVHGLAGLSNAMINTWPMVMISRSCDQKDFGIGDFQELDQIEVVKPFVKHHDGHPHPELNPLPFIFPNHARIARFNNAHNNTIV